MTKAVLILLGMMIAVASSASVELPGRPFQSAAPVAWSAAITNEIPKTLEVYKIVTRGFSSSTISNALALGPFKPTSLVRSPDKKVLTYKDSEDNMTRTLKLTPSEGSLWYFNNRAEGFPIKNVPSRAEVERLAVTYLAKLGGDTNQITTRKYVSESIARTVDRKSGKTSEGIINKRGIILSRQIVGLKVPGDHLSVDFANNSQIVDLQLDWQTLKSCGRYQTVSRNELLAWIRKGKANVVAPEGEVVPSVAAAKKLTITKMVPTFFRQGELLYPIAKMEIIAEMGGPNVVTNYLNCLLIPINTISNVP